MGYSVPDPGAGGTALQGPKMIKAARRAALIRERKLTLRCQKDATPWRPGPRPASGCGISAQRDPTPVSELSACDGRYGRFESMSGHGLLMTPIELTRLSGTFGGFRPTRTGWRGRVGNSHRAA